jgi:hypothetical protein
LQNIDVVDFERVGAGNGPSCRAIANSLGENFSAFGNELLAIVEPADLARRIEHHGGGENRTEQRASTGFVDTGDTTVSGGSGGALVAAAGH